MKRCPYCAEEVQDAAIVCKHCHKDLPAAASGVPAATAAGSPSRGTTVAAIALLAVIALVLFGRSAATTDPPVQVLSVTVARNALGLLITNREQSALRRCDVRFPDEGGDWYAPALTEPIAPSETISISWPRFTRNEQPLAGYLGMNAKRFVVSCFIGAETARREAAVGYN